MSLELSDNFKNKQEYLNASALQMLYWVFMRKMDQAKLGASIVEPLKFREHPMSDSSPFDFTKFVPGFDFLKQLSISNASLPQAHHWIAPTVDPKEIEKRIQELKTVHFWLEQNTKAVLATVQALEVQLMTINTLKGMNMSMAEMAKGLQIKPTQEKKAYFSQEPKTAPASSSPKANHETPKSQTLGKEDAPTQKPTPAVDPMAWWGSLSQQFSQIAEQTFAELQKTSAEVARLQEEGVKAGKASAKTVKKPDAKISKSAKSSKSSKPTGSAPAKRARSKSVKAKREPSRVSATAANKVQSKAQSKEQSKAQTKAQTKGKDASSSIPPSWFSSPPPLTRKRAPTKKSV